MLVSEDLLYEVKQALTLILILEHYHERNPETVELVDSSRKQLVQAVQRVKTALGETDELIYNPFYDLDEEEIDYMLWPLREYIGQRKAESEAVEIGSEPTREYIYAEQIYDKQASRRAPFDLLYDVLYDNYPGEVGC